MQLPRFTLRERLSALVAPALLLAMLLIAWEFAVRLLEIPRYLLPSPSVVVAAMAEHSRALLIDAAVTLLEAALGFVAGSLLAFAMAVLFLQSRLVERTLSPLIVGMQAVPIIVTAPLLIIWLGNGISSRILMAGLICLFPMIITSTTALRAVPRDALDLMEILSASRWQRLRVLHLPASRSHLFAGLRVTAALSVIGAIVAEMAGASQGIGFRVIMASYRTDTPLLFAAVVVAAACGVLLYSLVVLLEEFVTSRPITRRASATPPKVSER